jgi:hypothetical protein
MGGQTGRTASGVREPAAGAGRVRQEFSAAARRIGRAQLRALLRDGRDAALPSARTGKHSEAAVSSCRRVQSKPDPAQTTGRGHAAGVEEPLRQACFDSLLTFYVSDKSEAASQKPNLCFRCQVLREIAYPTTASDLQEIRYLHPGLLAQNNSLRIKKRDLDRWVPIGTRRYEDPTSRGNGCRVLACDAAT